MPLTSHKMLFPLKVKILCIATHQTDSNDGFWADQEMKVDSYFLFHIFLIQVCLFFSFPTGIMTLELKNHQMLSISKYYFYNLRK